MDADDPHATQHTRWVRALSTALEAFSTGSGYVNFPMGDEGEDRIEATYGQAKYDRLVKLKRLTTATTSSASITTSIRSRKARVDRALYSVVNWLWPGPPPIDAGRPNGQHRSSASIAPGNSARNSAVGVDDRIQDRAD